MSKRRTFEERPFNIWARNLQEQLDLEHKRRKEETKRRFRLLMQDDKRS